MTTITPELALIDPELAAAARALLPEPGRFRPASCALPAPAESLRAPLPPLTAVPLPPLSAQPAARAQPGSAHVPRSRRVAYAASFACIATIAVGALGFTQLSGPGPAPATASTQAMVTERALRARAAQDVQAASTYTWPAVPGAEAYEVTLLRGGQPIYQATTRELALELPNDLRLHPGQYAWSVKPRLNGPLQTSDARPVIEGVFRITAS
jgi:hypothetical protein